MCITELRALRNLQAYNNKLTGTIPTSIGECTELRKMSLRDNLLEGEVPIEAFVKMTKLQKIEFGVKPVSPEDSKASVLDDMSGSGEEFMAAYRRKYGTEVDGTGNQALWISSAGRDAIVTATQEGCSFMWPRIQD